MSQEGKELQTYKAYNITILLDGEEIQPEVPIQVGITGSGISGTEKSLFHIADGSSTAEKVSAIDTGNTQTFSAEGFSIYVISGSITGDDSDGTWLDRFKMSVNEEITLTENQVSTGGTWEVTEGDDVIKISEPFGGIGSWYDRIDPTVKVTSLKTGKATVKYSKDWDSKSFYIEVINNPKDGLVVRFDANGGSGEVPKEIEGLDKGQYIYLPEETNIHRDGYTFLGWSTTKDTNTVLEIYDGIDQEYDVMIYNPGSLYEVNNSVVLYAVWAKSEGALNQKMTIALRNDGTIPNEPSIQGNQYDYLIQAQTVNILDYVNPAHTVAGVNNVSNVLTTNFNTYVENINKRNGNKYWNPQTQYVEWYVIKYQENDQTWHIDGTVRNKEDVYLNYDGNGASNNYVPNSIKVLQGDNVVVSKAGNYYNQSEQLGWHDLEKVGYVFDCWNTKPDGSGEDYRPGENIKVDETITLYAQWKVDSSAIKTLTYTVEYYVDDVHQENDDQTVTEKVWINSTQTTLTVDKEGLSSKLCK